MTRDKIPYADTWTDAPDGPWTILPADPLRDPHTDDEPWPPTQMAHVTPVGCWLLIAFAVLVVVVVAVWRITHA